MIRQEQLPTIPTPPTPPLLPGFQDADIGTLQSQIANLRVDLAGLQAQWNGLRTQLDNMLRNNPARPGVQQQWADVGVQIARVEGNIATLQARIALKQGTFPGTPGARVRSSPWDNPAVVIPTVSIVSLTLLLPLAIGWARRISRRAPPAPAVPSEVSTRLERIEQAIDAIAIEVERVSEGQRYVTKIMAERPASAASNAGSPADQASNQAKQPLALGAGEAPAQPIVVVERERVHK
jgi:hypothetical protein